MLLRTHLAIGICAILVFIEHVTSPIPFIFMALVASVLPDIDSGFSTIGKHKVFKILQFFTKHRGVIHSFTFAFIISLILSLFFPALAFGFFLGYSLHLFADSFTKEGIYPFWPYSRKAQWKVKTGGVVDDTLFIAFLIINLILVVLLLGF